MPETQTYTGGCHCGRVRYEVRSDLEKVIACNCSICTKHGLILTFVPEQAFTLLSGDSGLTDYQFARKRIHHQFCADCGVESFARGATPDGKTVIAINVRCLDGVDLASLKPAPFDGKSL